MHKLTILLLGGSGFLGTHLAQRLLSLNATVRIFSQFKNKVKLSHPNLFCYEGDFIDGRGLQEALEGVDIVFHLISTTIPSTSNLNPFQDIQDNLVGSLSLFHKMKAMNVKRIIYISSGGTVYGNPLDLPVSEIHPLKPLCSYGIVKVAIENYLHMFSQLYHFQATILRIANPYGPYQSKIGTQGVVATFFQKILREEKIEIWGDGSAVRDYIHVDDVIEAMILILERNQLGIYNIGSGKGHSLLEVAAIISNVLSKQARIEFLPSRSFDVTKTYLDITKAKRALGWKPVYSLLKGCEAYWDCIKAKNVEMI